MILEMPADEGIALLTYALEQEQESKLYNRWVLSGAHLSIGFDDFKRSLVPPPPKSDAEILADVGAILSAYEALR